MTDDMGARIIEKEQGYIETMYPLILTQMKGMAPFLPWLSDVEFIKSHYPAVWAEAERRIPVRSIKPPKA